MLQNECHVDRVYKFDLLVLNCSVQVIRNTQCLTARVRKEVITEEMAQQGSPSPPPKGTHSQLQRQHSESSSSSPKDKQMKELNTLQAFGSRESRRLASSRPGKKDRSVSIAPEYELVVEQKEQQKEQQEGEQEQQEEDK